MDQSHFTSSEFKPCYDTVAAAVVSNGPTFSPGFKYDPTEGSTEGGSVTTSSACPLNAYLTTEPMASSLSTSQTVPLTYFSQPSSDKLSAQTYASSAQVYGVQGMASNPYGYYPANNMMLLAPGDMSSTTPLYILGGTELGSSSTRVTASLGTSARPFETTVDPSSFDVKKCHLHTKPQLTCKFCRKFKTAIHQQARVAQQREGRWAELQDLESTAWATVEMTNPTTYNVSTLLRENILASEYFKSLYGLQTFKEVVDEIFNYADHAEPYCAGTTRAPSTLFCCLYKLFTMRLKEHEVQALLDHTDSPYLRCVGFLYLRFVLPPEKLWDWLSPYFLDDEVFSTGVDKACTTSVFPIVVIPFNVAYGCRTIGEYVESLITEDRYFTIVLPRIPVKIKAQDGAQLITMPSHRKRKAQNKAKLEQFKPGVPVAVCSNGEWVEGRVLSIDGPDTGQCSCLVQLDDDVVDLVDLGLVIILEAKIRALKRREERRAKRISRGLPPFVRKRKKKKKTDPETSRTEKYHAASRTSNDETSRYDKDYKPHRHDTLNTSSRSRDTNLRHGERQSPYAYRQGRSLSASSSLQKQPPNVMEEFRKRERAKALASGKDYARRPTSYKSSLSLRFETSTGRKRSRSPPLVFRGPIITKPSPQADTEKKKQEPSLAYQQRMTQLVERYSKVNDKKRYG